MRGIVSAAAVAAVLVAAGSASAQYTLVPHRGHYHAVPTYSAPVYGGYTSPVYNSGITYGTNYYSPGVTYGTPAYGGGFARPSYYGGYAPNVGGHYHYIPGHYDYHRGHSDYHPGHYDYHVPGTPRPRH